MLDLPKRAFLSLPCHRLDSLGKLTLRLELACRMLISKKLWDKYLWEEGKDAGLKRGELSCNVVLAETSSSLRGSSEHGMIFQSCLNKKAEPAYLLFVSNWVQGAQGRARDLG